MSIEKNIERIADALEKLAYLEEVKASPAVVQTVVGEEAPPAEEKPKTAKKTKKYTIEDVRKFLIAFSKKNGEKEAIKLMLKYGASKVKTTIKSLPKEKYAELIESK